MDRAIKLLVMLLIYSFMSISNAHATTRTAANCTQAAVQAAVGLAVDGDTVAIPACSDTTWSTPVTIDCTSPLRSLTIQGAGQGQTNLVDANFTFIGANGKSFRATAMTLKGIGGFSVNGQSKNWRIDNITFYQIAATGSHRAIMVQPTGGYTVYTSGLVDHCTFDNLTAIAVHVKGNTSSYGNYEWTRPLNLGTADAVYVEDNTFKNDAYLISNPVTDCESGAAFVFRYNHVTNNYSEMHDAIITNTRGCRKWEYYNNVFTNTVDINTNIHLRSGSGVVFNNNFIGTVDNGTIQLILDRTWETGANPWISMCGTGSGKAYLGTSGSNYPLSCSSGADCVNIDGSSSNPNGYPCRDQIGWTGGTTQTSAPALFWNNTYNGSYSQPIVPHTQEVPYYTQGTDYCSNASSVMPATCNGINSSYIPYTYPHPLISGSLPMAKPRAPFLHP